MDPLKSEPSYAHDGARIAVGSDFFAVGGRPTTIVGGLGGDMFESGREGVSLEADVHHLLMVPVFFSRISWQDL